MTSRSSYAVLATRSAASVAGFAQRWCKVGGHVIHFKSLAGAEAYAKQMGKEMRSPNLSYEAMEHKDAYS